MFSIQPTDQLKASSTLFAYCSPEINYSRFFLNLGCRLGIYCIHCASPKLAIRQENLLHAMEQLMNLRQTFYPDHVEHKDCASLKNLSSGTFQQQHCHYPFCYSITFNDHSVPFPLLDFQYLNRSNSLQSKLPGYMNIGQLSEWMNTIASSGAALQHNFMKRTYLFVFAIILKCMTYREIDPRGMPLVIRGCAESFLPPQPLKNHTKEYCRRIQENLDIVECVCPNSEYCGKSSVTKCVRISSAVSSSVKRQANASNPLYFASFNAIVNENALLMNFFSNITTNPLSGHSQPLD
ncbi:conserved hypothetical protein [Trichinella spiralis]|uniref:hypothetical protein n=1 Tax=Trichinella spiralis TaxID=6334 RepID=UPI0001EFC7BE|nr:conserved hypothetical protein [Trichinella spiralis]